MPIFRSNHPSALAPGISKWFGLSYKSTALICKALVDTTTSKRAWEEIREDTGFPLMPEKEEGGTFIYTENQEGYGMLVRHTAYAMGYSVTSEEIDDNLYEEVANKRAGRLSFSARQTEEYVVHDLYNKGFDPTRPLGNGQPWFSASHPSVGGAPQSNVLPSGAGISETAIEDMVTMIHLAEDAVGLKIALTPKMMLIHPSKWFEATRVLRSVLRYNTNAQAWNNGNATVDSNAMNVLRDQGHIQDVISSPFFSDQDAWYVRTNVPDNTGPVRYNRTKLGFAVDSDFQTMNMLHRAYMRFSVAVGDWRGGYASTGI